MGTAGPAHLEADYCMQLSIEGTPGRVVTEGYSHLDLAHALCRRLWLRLAGWNALGAEVCARTAIAFCHLSWNKMRIPSDALVLLVLILTFAKFCKP